MFFINRLRQGFTLIEVIFALSLFGMLVGGLLAFLPWGVDGVSKVKDRNTAMGLIDAVQIELERLGFVVVEAGTHRLRGLYEFVGEPSNENYINQLILVAGRKGGCVSLEKVTKRMQVFNKEGQLTIDTEQEAEVLNNFAKDLGGQIEFDTDTKGLDPGPISLKGMSSLESAGFNSHVMNRWIDPKDRYFAIICSQYPAESRHAHHVSNGYLALECEVQWPYKIFAPGNKGSADPLLSSAREIPMEYRTTFRFPTAISR